MLVSSVNIVLGATARDPATPVVTLLSNVNEAVR